MGATAWLIAQRIHTQALEQRLKAVEEDETTRRLNELYEHEDSSPDLVMTQIQAEALALEQWLNVSDESEMSKLWSNLQLHRGNARNLHLRKKLKSRGS